ncbi:thiamine phosphate synthase [Halapricum desulfuricans]|uniref:Thiamine-phosphate synthase n=1 Tax=Halapricum desulfuricans TaxID=2841257 RepID=A0A897NFH8_9EURY|nr:thiamine phosphate synthase [Halapricum desulfuricans]QSG10185.1 Thiamine monophosphate synthase [Halapricum desulfuricans]
MTDWDVYLVTQAGRSEGRETRAIVRKAIEGGVDIVQLREKGVPARDRYHLGRELRALTRDAGVPLIVNDRVDIAQAIDADGVHLGDEDLPVRVARELLGEEAIVGRSVSFVEDAREAERFGADYLGVGAIYPTDSKDDIDDDEYAIGLERLEAICEAVDIPVVGIGGVDADNAGDVAAAGADGVAVISAITGAADPAAATRELGEAVRAGRSP